MRDLAVLPDLPAMAPEHVDLVRQLETEAFALPQLPLETTHTFHAGIYARTITLQPNTMITGCLVKIPTLLIFDGDAFVYIGGDHMRLAGHHVLKADAGRKQVFVAVAETSLTMSFATEARTVEEAEAEFTDEAHLLVTRRG